MRLWFQIWYFQLQLGECNLGCFQKELPAKHWTSLTINQQCQCNGLVPSGERDPWGIFTNDRQIISMTASNYVFTQCSSDIATFLHAYAQHGAYRRQTKQIYSYRYVYINPRKKSLAQTGVMEYMKTKVLIMQEKRKVLPLYAFG